jgi:hypothetical protein
MAAEDVEDIQAFATCLLWPLGVTTTAGRQGPGEGRVARRVLPSRRGLSAGYDELMAQPRTARPTASSPAKPSDQNTKVVSNAKRIPDIFGRYPRK